jgi:peptide/nickel transport system substrate-binding protein
MPPGIPGRTEYNPLPGHEPGTTDTAKAKQLLKDAGKLGYEIKWLFSNDDPQSVKAKDVTAKSLTAAGFKASPVATTVADFSTERSNPNNSKINVRSGGWLSDWPSGGSWFPPVLGSTNLKEEGVGSNYAIFNEPEVDKKINDIQMMPAAKQPAAWNELDKFIAEKYFPLFVTGYGGVAMAHGSKIQGFDVDQAHGTPTWANIWVQQ